MTIKKMLILTGLFPNAQGNQSMLNSLIGYEREYSILLLTVANMASDAYMPVDAVAKRLPRTKTLVLWPRLKQRTRALLSRQTKKNKREISTINRDDSLINTKITRKIRLVFFIRSLMLALGGIISVLLFRPHVICVYEINGMLAARLIRLFFPNIFIFGKFQGTVLGGNLCSDNFFQVSAILHPLDAAALRHAAVLNGAIMTNDGTHGQEVLRRFGLPGDKVLFLPNGVDEKFITASAIHRNTYRSPHQEKSSLETISLSRLIGWKRVDRIIEALAILEKYNPNKIRHTIIGGGDECDQNFIKNNINSKSLSHSVEFLGGQSIEDVIKALSKKDLLISVYKPTNIANPVFEALAMGVPVLTIFDDKLVEVLGERTKGCFFIDEPGSENLPRVLASKLSEIDREAIEEKKKILENMAPPSWSERSVRELDYISGLTSR